MERRNVLLVAGLHGYTMLPGAPGIDDFCAILVVSVENPGQEVAVSNVIENQLALLRHAVCPSVFCIEQGSSAAVDAFYLQDVDVGRVQDFDDVLASGKVGAACAELKGNVGIHHSNDLGLSFGSDANQNGAQEHE